MCLLLFFFCLIFFQNLRFRINIKFSAESVDHCHFPIPFFLNVYLDQCRNIHRSCQDRSVGIGRAKLRHKPKKFTLIKLNGLAWRQIFRHDDRRLVPALRLSDSHQDIDHPLGNIFHVNGSRLKIFIFHRREHRRKIISRCCDGIFCIYHLCLNDTFYRIIVIIIFQHHLMYFKNLRAGFANFFERFLIKLSQLFFCRLARIFVTFDLRRGILDLCTLYLFLFFCKKVNRSDRNSAENGFSLNDFHCLSPVSLLNEIIKTKL